MRLCRFLHNDEPHAGFYFDEFIVPLSAAVEAHAASTGRRLNLSAVDDLLPMLPPDGDQSDAARELATWLTSASSELPENVRRSVDTVQLLVPIPRPNKLFLLAGNYAAHVEEGGELAAERDETFPYVFMKPPSTSLSNPGAPIKLPSVSPTAIDYELELAVVMGRRAKGIRETEALDYVAGFTVINDISNRRFRPNPIRKQRDRDKFFDWLHGKWHDTSCPCGPCITTRDSISDPQNLAMRLRVNGQLRQNATTALQVFPVAAVIEFISSIVTLEPGDIISTGTPAGVGASTDTFLQPGDRIEASIESIGTLTSTVESE